MIFTMIGEEALEVYLEYALVVLLEAYGAEQGFVLYLSYIDGVMNAAKVDKVERSSSENEH